MPTRWLCKRYSAFLAAYDENALPPKAAAQVEAHLASCAACREDLQALRQVSGILLAHKPGVPEPPADLWRCVQAEITPVTRPAWRLPAFAAPVVGLAAAVAFAFLVVRPGNDMPTVNDAAGSPVSASSARPMAPPTPVAKKSEAARQISRSVPNPAESAALKINTVPRRRIAAAPVASGPDPFVRIEQRDNKLKAKRKPVRRALTVAASPPRRPLSENVRLSVAAKPAESVLDASVMPPQSVASVNARGAGNVVPEGTITNDSRRADSRALYAYGIAASPAPDQPETEKSSDTESLSYFADSAASPATLTGPREVPASASAVTRYLNDKRKSSLFRYSQR